MMTTAPPALPGGGGFDAASNKPQGTEAYTFVSEPKAVTAGRKKYRDPNEKEQRAP
jgi:hypothetical protein